MIQRAKRVIKRIIRGHRVEATPNWQSETSKCRPRLAKFCVGYGIDIGPGGDPIVPAAIRVDLPNPYSCLKIFSMSKASWLSGFAS